MKNWWNSNENLISQKVRWKVQGLNATLPIVWETEFQLKLANETVPVKALILKGLKFQADGIIGNEVLNKTNAVMSYGEKTVTIFDHEISFLGSTNSQYPFVNNQCLVADFIYIYLFYPIKRNWVERIKIQEMKLFALIL